MLQDGDTPVDVAKKNGYREMVEKFEKGHFPSELSSLYL